MTVFWGDFHSLIMYVLLVIFPSLCQHKIEQKSLEVWCQRDEAKLGGKKPWQPLATTPTQQITIDGGVVMGMFFPNGLNL